MKVSRLFCLIFLTTFLSDKICFAQEDTLKKEKVFKNTINYNISNPLIFGFKTIVFGYERVLGKNQSAAIELGEITFPKFSLLSGSLKSNHQSTEKGYKIVLEYRFYPKNENKYNAPRGVYFAPYFAYNYFNRKNTFDIESSTTGVPVEITVATDFKLEIYTGGLELGYQFVFWKRFALDLVLIGPGISKYKVSASLDTSLDPDEESDLFTAINDAISEKIPGYSLVIKPGEFNRTGTVNTTSIGFRYLVKVGFRF